MKTLGKVLWDAAKLWYDKDADHMAATVSYYALFAFVPLIFMTVTFTGLLYGDSYVATVLLAWGSVLGPDMLSLLDVAVKNLKVVSGDFVIPFVGVVFFSGMVIVMFNTFTTGLMNLWGDAHQGLKGWLKKSLRSVLFVVLLQFFILSLIGIDALVSSLDSSFPVHTFRVMQVVMVVIATSLIFAIAYGVLPWRPLSWRHRLYGGLVASLLFSLAKIMVAMYVIATPVPGLFGAAGLILVLLIWQYVTSCILYYGAAVAYTYDSLVRNKQ